VTRARLSLSSLWELALVAFSAGAAAQLGSLLTAVHPVLPITLAMVGVTLFAWLHFSTLRNGKKNALALLEPIETPDGFAGLAAAHDVTLAGTLRSRNTGVFWIHAGHRTGMLAVSDDLACTDATFAHELGHGVLDHLPRRYVFQFLLAASATLVPALVSLAQEAVLATVLAALAAPSSLLLNVWYCRRQEAQADGFACSVVGAPALAEALVALEHLSVSVDDLLSMHPTLDRRLALLTD
jgi:hypothetical protein